VLNGETLETQKLLIPVQLITKENVKDYKGWTK
jgi:ABC-type sugar transport system substrate-binding protein